MMFNYGERVVIDFSLDKLDKSNPPMFGYITDIIIEDEVQPGTLVKRKLYKAIGDDGVEYLSIDLGHGKPLVHTFYNKRVVLQLINERNADLNKELEVLKEYEQIYMESYTKRMQRGLDPGDLESRYERFGRLILNEAKVAADIAEYFNEYLTTQFSKKQF